jgi:hypothetical protein
MPEQDLDGLERRIAGGAQDGDGDHGGWFSSQGTGGPKNTAV